MITFESVTKRYRLRHGSKVILDHATFSIPRGSRLGVLGINGAGKSTLLRLVSGNELPDSGRIRRSNVSVSWPLGFADSFHGSLTGRENIRFVCRIYGRRFEEVVKFVQSFAELGEHLDMPVKTYSSGMKARLAFGLSMAFDFDVYLVDEITAVGDARFKEKCSDAFKNKLVASDLIVVSHSTQTLLQYCTSGCVLHDGNLQFYASIGDAILAYDEIIRLSA